MSFQLSIFVSFTISVLQFQSSFEDLFEGLVFDPGTFNFTSLSFSTGFSV